MISESSEIVEDIRDETVVGRNRKDDGLISLALCERGGHTYSPEGRARERDRLRTSSVHGPCHSLGTFDGSEQADGQQEVSRKPQREDIADRPGPDGTAADDDLDRTRRGSTCRIR
ncbi:unnamed protein product [Hermetia illucens]|uniref:Uncharacterized protein n=1 Tax=Hermetia illucens TaxID=343691 RepID=A0A7R8YNW5_HERIL|nr:unnamed protein product [Hermetia illucens]